MREKRDFNHRSASGRLTPEKLMKILSDVDIERFAKETYQELTGFNPPPEPGEIITEKEDNN